MAGGMRVRCSSILTVVGLLSLLAGTPAATPGMPAQDAKPPAAPSIRIGTTEQDYGVLLQGEIIERQIAIHNDGGAPLVIRKIEPMCACTRILAYDREITAGGSGTIRFEVNSKKIRPEGISKRKRLRIESNDPANGKAHYWFSVGTVSLFRTQPPQIFLSGLFDRDKELGVTLDSATSFGFEILEARSRNGRFEVVKLEEVEKDRSYRALLRARSNPQPKKERDPLDLKIKVRDGRVISVGTWVNIHHQDPVQLIPPGPLQFRNRDTDALLKEGAPPVIKTLSLTSIDPAVTIQIESVELEGVPEGAFSVEVMTLAPGSRYAVKVSLPHYRKESYLRGKLIIRTTDARNPVREIPLQARFGKR
ncbi:MAG: DUF1573 domain-containing protein [Planctomycetota bacterium]